MATIVSRHVRIKGRVQGVWYRGWTLNNATKHGLSGWVRNRIDGTVEAVFCGPEKQVESMIEACYSGPPSAKVTNVEVKAGSPVSEASFQQLPTL